MSIEQAAEEYSNLIEHEHDNNLDYGYGAPLKKGFVAGAEYQKAQYMAVIEEAKTALRFYSTKPNEKIENQIEWNPHVCDSYSGQMYAPDWSGDLQDEPNDIAEKTLASIEEKLKQINGGE